MRRIPLVRRTLALFGLTMGACLVLDALEMPNLSGTWQLNKDASDDPQKVMSEARAAAPGGGPPGGGHGSGGHGGGGHGPGAGSPGGMGSPPGGRHGSGDEGASGPDPKTLAALETLKISHSEPMLSITDAAGRERVVYTDGRTTEQERSHGGTTKVEARWRDGRIEIISKPSSGPKVIEAFSITADGSQLTVTTKMEGERMGPVTIRRIYDAVKTPAPASKQDQPGGAEVTEAAAAGAR
jgi:hypothetical protein